MCESERGSERWSEKRQEVNGLGERVMSEASERIVSCSSPLPPFLSRRSQRAILLSGRRESTNDEGSASRWSCTVHRTAARSDTSPLSGEAVRQTQRPPVVPSLSVCRIERSDAAVLSECARSIGPARWRSDAAECLCSPRSTRGSESAAEGVAAVAAQSEWHRAPLRIGLACAIKRCAR